MFDNEFFAIMGPSGSGKSTLFNQIGALQKPTAGQVLIDGVNLATLTPKQLAAVRCFELGYIFQTYNLLPAMSALMNVALPTIFAGMSTAEGDKRAMECLEIVGIGEAAIENPDIEVTAGGGLLCSLFGAAGGALTDSFLQPFADTVNQLVDDLRDDLIGVEICE